MALAGGRGVCFRNRRYCGGCNTAEDVTVLTNPLTINRTNAGDAIDLFAFAASVDKFEYARSFYVLWKDLIPSRKALVEE